MARTLTDPIVLIALIAATVGVVLLVHARVQTRLLRGRIARGDSTVVVDPVTGLFAPATAWQCIRAEASRAARLQRPLDVWVGTAHDATVIDGHGREIVFDMPRGATAVRLDARHIFVLSCAGATTAPAALDDVAWTQRTFSPDDRAAPDAYAFVSEVANA